MRITDPISRRTFIGDTAKLGIAALAIPATDSLFGAEAGPLPSGTPWQIGCYTRVFDQFDCPVALDAMAEAGFKYVGLMTTKIKQWVMIKTTTPVEEVQAMHKEARKRGLKGPFS